ncbi:MAG: type VI secretion system baseplate subunit TssF, partial [Gammaproteobacteria bacterium]
RLPFGPYEPALSFYDKAGEGVLVKCLMAPTPTRQPRLGSSTGWQFISLITLQSFSGEGGLETLKRVLSLYDPIETASSASLVDGIIQLTTTPVSMRVTRHGRSAFCHGTRIILTVDQQYYTGNGVYVFGEVLSEFFGHLCSINSFTQLEIRVTQRPEEPFIWPACSGTEVLV